MAELTATVKRLSRVPVIWLVPVVAAVLGLWMVVYAYMNEGPEITITFDTANGIEPGKTKIKALNVELGVVESVEFTESMERVVVTAKLERFATPLLRDDTVFWVVRPRVGPGGISGLGTLLSGSFIRLAAGTGEAGRRDFEGLDKPAVTPAGAPGLKLHLSSDRAGSVSPGDPVLFHGYRVGQVETSVFDSASQRIGYTIFIDEPYDELVSRNTRFWNASGISINASADGIQVEVGSLQTLLIGGIAFDLPDDVLPGLLAKNGDRFNLLPNRKAFNQKHYEKYLEYVVSFSQTVRGLKPGAPVEYRGVPVGTVQRVLVTEWMEPGLAQAQEQIPVLIRIEPGRFGLPDDENGIADLETSLEVGLARGMRASLEVGNMLTGSALVTLDFYPEEGSAQLGEFAGYPEIPTISGGILQLERQLGQLLRKLNALPIEPVIRDLDAALVSLRKTLESIQGLVDSDATQAIPASINTSLHELATTLDAISPDSEGGERLQRMLGELSQTLRNIESLTRTLAEKPNTIIFSPPAAEDPDVQKRPSP